MVLNIYVGHILVFNKIKEKNMNKIYKIILIALFTLFVGYNMLSASKAIKSEVYWEIDYNEDDLVSHRSGKF